MVLAVVQVGVVFARQTRVVAAARDGARRAAVTDDNGAVTATVEQRLRRDQTTVIVNRSGGDEPLARVEVAHVVRTEVPLVGPLMPDITVRSSFVIAQERR